MNLPLLFWFRFRNLGIGHLYMTISEANMEKRQVKERIMGKPFFEHLWDHGKNLQRVKGNDNTD